jgi:hypothetical protein
VTPAVVFYQSLAGVSFTLLGLWFAVLSLGHESWRGAERRRSTLQVEGTIVAGVLLAGLSYVWLAFAERLPADRTSGH